MHLNAANMRVQSTRDYGYTVDQYKCRQIQWPFMVDLVLKLLGVKIETSGAQVSPHEFRM